MVNYGKEQIFTVLCVKRVIVLTNTIMFYFQLGPEVLNNEQALQEMIEIAGSEEKFFKVSSYAALKNILSSLQIPLLRAAGKPEHL